MPIEPPDPGKEYVDMPIEPPDLGRVLEALRAELENVRVLGVANPDEPAYRTAAEHLAAAVEALEKTAARAM
jgi:hypothetical protein